MGARPFFVEPHYWASTHAAAPAWRGILGCGLAMGSGPHSSCNASNAGQGLCKLRRGDNSIALDCYESKRSTARFPHPPLEGHHEHCFPSRTVVDMTPTIAHVAGRCTSEFG
eukprot:gene17064-biopygen18851